MSYKLRCSKGEQARIKKFINVLKHYWNKGVAVLVAAGFEEETANEIFQMLAFTMFECGITLDITEKALLNAKKFGKLKMTENQIREFCQVLGEIREVAISFSP